MKLVADILLRVSAITATLLALAANLAWGDTMASRGGRYSVDFPGPAWESSQTINTSAGPTTAHILSYRSREAEFTALYSDYSPGAVQRMPVDLVYAGAIEGAVKGAGGKLRSSAPVQVGNVTGREAVFDAPNGSETVRVRYFLVGSRLYQLMYDGPKGTERRPKATHFLNSFELESR